MNIGRPTTALLATLLAMGCGSGATPAPADPSAGIESSFTLKVLRNTGENPFSVLAYECDECSFAQHAALEPPPGWTKAPAQVILPIGELRSRPSVDDGPSSVDLIPEIPGDDFTVIARTLNGRIVEAGPNGIVAVVQVMRDTTFLYPAGTRVHELTDPEGNVFVLFAYQVASEDFTSPVFQDADALVKDPRPEGWTYTTRILDNDLHMDPGGVATVLAIRAEVESTWELRSGHHRASHPVMDGDAASPALDLWGIEGGENERSGLLVRYRSRRDVLTRPRLSYQPLS